MWATAVLATLRREPWPPLLVISLCGWIVLALGGRALALPELCGGGALGRPSDAAWSWGIMLLAMTPLLMAEPLRRLWFGSLRRRRLRACLAFVAGFVAAWALAGAPLAAVAGALARASGGLAWAVAGGLAVAWCASPLRRRVVLAGHRTPSLRVFGLAADLDSLRYGLVSGVWCVAACGPLMLVPLLMRDGHVAVMAAASLLMTLDRLAGPRPARRTA